MRDTWSADQGCYQREWRCRPVKPHPESRDSGWGAEADVFSFLLNIVRPAASNSIRQLRREVWQGLDWMECIFGAIQVLPIILAKCSLLLCYRRIFRGWRSPFEGSMGGFWRKLLSLPQALVYQPLVLPTIKSHKGLSSDRFTMYIASGWYTEMIAKTRAIQVCNSIIRLTQIPAITVLKDTIIKCTWPRADVASLSPIHCYTRLGRNDDVWEGFCMFRAGLTVLEKALPTLKDSTICRIHRPSNEWWTSQRQDVELN